MATSSQNRIETLARYAVMDTPADDRLNALPAVQKDRGIRFYAGAPLRMRNGTWVGTLCVIDIELRAEFDPQERAALQRLARRTFAALGQVPASGAIAHLEQVIAMVDDLREEAA